MMHSDIKYSLSSDKDCEFRRLPDHLKLDAIHMLLIESSRNDSNLEASKSFTMIKEALSVSLKVNAMYSAIIAIGDLENQKEAISRLEATTDEVISLVSQFIEE